MAYKMTFSKHADPESLISGLIIDQNDKLVAMVNRMEVGLLRSHEIGFVMAASFELQELVERAIAYIERGRKEEKWSITEEEELLQAGREVLARSRGELT